MEINPVSVARALVEKVKNFFPNYNPRLPPTSAEKQIAQLLFEKFEEISINYEFVEDNDNDFASLLPGASEENTASSSSMVVSQDFKMKTKKYISIKQKAKILKIIDENPAYSEKSIVQKYPYYKRAYRTTWRHQVQEGGSRLEISEEINSYIFKRFKEARDVHQPVHDSDLRKWAMQRATDFPSFRTSFTASNKFLNKFKREHGISSRKITKLVSKREISSEEEILKSAEDFRTTILSMEPSYDLSEIWNTDQIGFTYEYMSNRTLTFTGEKFTFGSAFSPKDRLTHSYTVQYIISADGSVIGDAFVCLQEPDGRLGESVLKNLFYAPNLTVTCSKSGKLTSSHVKFFVDEMIKPAIGSKVLYILDSWTGHVNDKIYSEGLSLENVDFKLKVIPKHCTPFVQPLDVYFNLQLKYIVKRIYAYANLTDLRLTSRNDILMIQSLVHFILSAPCFKNMIKYCWKKAGLINYERSYFENAKDACFSFRNKCCTISNCTECPFIKCSWCAEVLCFAHFYFDYHLSQCSKSPYCN